MAFEIGTEELVCPSCSAKHVAKWSRMPVRDHATVCCQACGAVMHSAKTVRDYFLVTLSDKQPLA